MLEGQELLDFIDRTTQENASIIEGNMGWALWTVNRVYQQGKLKDGFDPQLIDPSLSCLSEMPVCAALILNSTYELYEPAGFYLAEGSVSFPIGINTGTDNHYFYWIPENDNVFCICPGQFTAYNQIPERKGAKLNLLQQKAPSLVRRITDELTILRGPREEVLRQLGLNYSPVRLPKE